MILVVDVANVMGSRPDGWWRDRVGAAQRLLGELAGLVGREVSGPDGRTAAVRWVVAVVEGRARAVTDPDVEGLRVVRADRDGDATVVQEVHALGDTSGPVVVITADRGLRARLPARCAVAGPTWLLAL
jgi:hypothetical protein